MVMLYEPAKDKTHLSFLIEIVHPVYESGSL